MNQDELKQVFDQQAAHYDQQWTRMAPINNGLYFLLESVFAALPADAQILCVGVGTGKELIYLAKRFPGWRFTAVEPSGEMLAVCRQVAEQEGVASRCYFHEGYLDSLAADVQHDGATCFLVSQFILENAARSEFFQQIADRLKSGGILASSDLSYDTAAENYDALLVLWQKVMSGTSGSPDIVKQMKATYSKNVAVLPPAEVTKIIESGGFGTAVPFFQAGLIRAWAAKRV